MKRNSGGSIFIIPILFIIATDVQGQERCALLIKDENCGFMGISEFICHIRGCCYDVTLQRCYYPKDYFDSPGKKVAAFLGTSVLNIPTPTNALADSLIRKALEAELKKAFRYHLPQVAAVKVKNFTDATFDYVLSLSLTADDDITLDTLLKSYGDAVQQRNPLIANGKYFDGYPDVKDLDECSFGAICGTSSVCVNAMGSYFCDCRAGYSKNGTGFCDDIDECTRSSSCRRTQDCFNTVGSYECRCKSGYQPNPTENDCTDVDECLRDGANDCATDKEICGNRIGGFECRCRNNYTIFGKTYCVADNPCNSNPCHDNAVCMIDGTSYICKCSPGYTDNGDNGCKAIDFCFAPSFNNCHPKAACEALPGRFSCKCLDGYVGDGILFCDDIDECLSPCYTNCGVDAKCVNTDGSYRCDCNEGFELTVSGQCADVDECMSFVPLHNCHVNATCVNTIGSFECNCAAGYEGDGVLFCGVVYPTSTGLHCDPFYGAMRVQTSQSVTCASDALCTLGSSSFYSCKCPIGLEGYQGLFCQDIDECVEGIHSCHARARCNNTDSSYICICDVGYFGSGEECVDVDECAEGMHDCLHFEICVNTKGSYRCDCKSGFVKMKSVCQELLLFGGLVTLNTSYVYSERLLNTDDPAFRNLAKELQDYLMGLYGWKNQNVLDVTVSSFMNGSIIAEHVVAAINTGTSELYGTFQSALNLRSNSMVSRSPTLLTKITLVPSELLLPVGSASGFLPRIRSIGNIEKTFTGIVHLRPTAISRFESMYGETILNTNSLARRNFVAKLARDLTNLHDSGNLVDLRVSKIELARPLLQTIAGKVRSPRTKFFKASTTLWNTREALGKTGGLFHNMMRYIVPDYTRRYRYSLRQPNVSVSESCTETNQSFNFWGPISVSLVDTRTHNKSASMPGDFEKESIIVDHLLTIYEERSNNIDATFLSQSFQSSTKNAKQVSVIPIAPEVGLIYYFVSLFQEWNITSIDVVGQDILSATYEVITQEDVEENSIEEVDLYNGYDEIMSRIPPSEQNKLAVVGIPKKMLMTKSVVKQRRINDTIGVKNGSAGIAPRKDGISYSFSIEASIFLMNVIQPVPLVTLSAGNPEFKRVASIFQEQLQKAFSLGLQHLSRYYDSFNISSLILSITDFRKPFLGEMVGSGTTVADFKIALDVIGSELTADDLEGLVAKAYEVSVSNGFFTESMFIAKPWNILGTIVETGSGFEETTVDSRTTTIPQTYSPTRKNTQTRPTTTETLVPTTAIPTNIHRTTTFPISTTTPISVNSGLADALALLLQSPGLSFFDIQLRVTQLPPSGRALLMILLDNPETKLFMPDYAMRFLRAALQIY